jgi:hypothetical protein
VAAAGLPRDQPRRPASLPGAGLSLRTKRGRYARRSPLRRGSASASVGLRAGGEIREPAASSWASGPRLRGYASACLRMPRRWKICRILTIG